MKEIDRQAVAEVLEILNNSEKEITDKISDKFMRFLQENADKEYKVNIDFNNEHWDDTIKKETKVILALIYRDYLVPKEEKIRLLKEEKERLDKEEQELHEKYNPDNLFKNNVTTTKKENIEEKQEELNNMKMIEVKEDSWFKKIWKKIISMFGKK